MAEETPRSRAAREAAEAALVRVVHHYGERPEFVALGGLVPELLCAGSGLQHAGTTDVDVQVNLEIQCGAVNLRGTGFASRDIVVQKLRARVGGTMYDVEVNVTGLAGYLLAKTAAAHSRRKPKDWYDLAFVLLHNDAGGPKAASKAVKEKFSDDLEAVRTALSDLLANFKTANAQGPTAYSQQMLLDHPGMNAKQLAADAILAVEEFHNDLFAK
ncbi:nucleotidyl transferase AbiEii/AbiGii toxin family protein [Bdellovibrionota bacterium FG-2]